MRTQQPLDSEHNGSSSSTDINVTKSNDDDVKITGVNVPPMNDQMDQLHPLIQDNIKTMGYTTLTPVQKYAVPILMALRDLMACAQTGSGKTLAFLLPIVSSILINGGPTRISNIGSSTKAYPICLVLAPTRELCQQIFYEAQKICYNTGIRPVMIYGGSNIHTQAHEVSRGCDILVATPGRLMDFINRGFIAMEGVRILILDEADRMLDMGFMPQIRKIVDKSGMPPPGTRHTMMFSATFPKKIQKLAEHFLRNSVFLEVGRVGGASSDVTQTFEYVDNHDKQKCLMHFLETITEGLVIVFVETKRCAEALEHHLHRAEYPATSIHGDRSQQERERALEEFKSGRCPILVATDVVGRGLDVMGVTQVINYDMPKTIDDYVHRIGRTGRAGNVGNALSMVNDKNKNIIHDLVELLHQSNQKVPSWMTTMARGLRDSHDRDSHARDSHDRNSHDCNHSNGGPRNFLSRPTFIPSEDTDGW